MSLAGDDPGRTAEDAAATGPDDTGQRATGPTDPDAKGTATTVVVLDADTVAGWRRSVPSLAQLRSAESDLRRSHPDVEVAVVADPSMKWALDPAEQDRFETDIVARAVVCAPAGTRGGTNGWLTAVAERVRANGDRVLMVTDRAVAGVPVVRISRDGDAFAFDLEGAREVEGRTGTSHRRRPGRRR